MTNVSINIFKSIDRVYLLSSIHGSVLITYIDVIDPASKSQKEHQEQEVQREEKEARRSGQRGVGISEGRGKEIEDEMW